MAQRDSSPVYYREIQKNAFLKRLPEETGSKLLSLKKPPLKPMWTQLCIHNGRTPYLEQYRDPVSARAHRPLWRACLSTARHVTASVTPRDCEHDFLIDTGEGPVRMLAPTWECMQDWVTTLRYKLNELKIVPPCENVYMSEPVAPPPRAAARDPTSPLPPPPPTPPVRVPGIDLSSVTRSTPVPEPPDPSDIPEPVTSVNAVNDMPSDNDEPEIDISNWDELSVPSTSQAPTSVAKICGQNICLDNSIFKRGDDDVDSDSVSSQRTDDEISEPPSNITVIQVSNKDPPHTAPVLSPDSNVFDFDFKTDDFVNIVNTENSQNDYGTVFESDYGHLSLTTTVSLTGNNAKNDDVYERLCMASTKPSPLPVRKLREKRKSSLPNLDTNTTYGYLFNNNSSTGNIVIPSVTEQKNSTTTPISITSNVTPIVSNNISITSTTATPISIFTNVAPISITSSVSINSNKPITINNSNVTPITTSNFSITSNPISISNSYSNTPVSSNIPISSNSSMSNNSSVSNVSSPVSFSANSTSITNINSSTGNVSTEVNRNLDLNARGIRVERNNSQNAYDASTSPRRERNEAKSKNDKSEPQQKPIWKRGLTELSLLTRLKIGQSKRPESPGRNDNSRNTNGVNSPVKVVHRSRPETRVDRTRRRSSSLTNGQPPVATGPARLAPLVARQAAALQAAQRRGAALTHTLTARDQPLFVDYDKQVWIAWWGPGGARCGGRSGDRVRGVRATAPKDAAHAHRLLHSAHTHLIDILFHRVPLGKIYVVNKRDKESIGIKLDSECNIVSVEPDSPASRAGIPPVGKWALTEVNNRPVNLLKGGEEDMNRISYYGTEASVLLQPTAFVKKLRAALKGNKGLLGLR